jgi:hypothetical protein
MGRIPTDTDLDGPHRLAERQIDPARGPGGVREVERFGRSGRTRGRRVALSVPSTRVPEPCLPTRRRLEHPGGHRKRGDPPTRRNRATADRQNRTKPIERGKQMARSGGIRIQVHEPLLRRLAQWRTHQTARNGRYFRRPRQRTDGTLLRSVLEGSGWPWRGGARRIRWIRAGIRFSHSVRSRGHLQRERSNHRPEALRYPRPGASANGRSDRATRDPRGRHRLMGRVRDTTSREGRSLARPCVSSSTTLLATSRTPSRRRIRTVGPAGIRTHGDYRLRVPLPTWESPGSWVPR